MSLQRKKNAACHIFKLSEYIVYPAHGVGQIVAIEEEFIAGYELELFVVYFEKDKMHVKVPVSKVESIGMRKLVQAEGINEALEILQGRAKAKRAMWARRAQEYEAKINSGEIVAIAEVVRDLFRADTQPEQSYSERQIYELALARLTREVSVVKHLSEKAALALIEANLSADITPKELSSTKLRTVKVQDTKEELAAVS